MTGMFWRAHLAHAVHVHVRSVLGAHMAHAVTVHVLSVLGAHLAHTLSLYLAQMINVSLERCRTLAGGSCRTFELYQLSNPSEVTSHKYDQ
jgi:hypothetical protein